MAFDIYAAVTDRIIDQLGKGEIPWAKPWVCGAGDLALSRSNGKPYSLLNQILLGKPGEYASFKQIVDAGGKVKKGAKSHMVVFWKMFLVDETDKDGAVIVGPDGKPLKKSIPYLKYFNVFEIGADTEGIEPKYYKDDKDGRPVSHAEKVDKAEAVLRGYLDRSGVKFGNVAGDRAFYSPLNDSITVPEMEQFESTEEYYSTVFHEAVHSTGHKSRLDRFKAGYFGDAEYSKEELVAEIGAAGILNSIGMESESSFKNSAAYVQGWLKALKNDTKLIVAAAGKAQKAMEMITGNQAAEEAAA